jgi:hypothetical protein
VDAKDGIVMLQLQRGVDLVETVVPLFASFIIIVVVVVVFVASFRSL